MYTNGIFYFTCLLGTKYYDVNGVYKRIGYIWDSCEMYTEFYLENLEENFTSLEHVQFPVSVPSDIEVVRWE